MKDLIEALQIFLKYKDEAYPIYCAHEELQIHGYDYSEISDEDKKRLEELSFSWSEDDECFYSFRYGSC